MTDHRKLLALLVFASVAVGACSSGGDDTASAPTSTPSAATTPATTTPSTTQPSPPTSTPAATNNTLAALAAGGVAVVEDGSPAPAGSTLAVTRSQADNLARQVEIGGGLPGIALRQKFPLGDDVVPIDALMGAWLTTDTPAAVAAATLVDASTLTDPASFVFPWAVIQLFINDLAQPASQPAGFASGVRAPVAPQLGTSDPCGAIQDFYAETVGATIAGLQGSDSVVGQLAGLALGLFVDALATTVKAAIPAAVKTVVQALGVAAAIAGAVEPWTAALVSEPTATAKGIAPAAGNPGAVMLKVETGTGDWPPAVKSCASLAGVTLPQLDPAGAVVEWTMIAADMADEAAREAVIAPTADGYGARFDYVTRVETVTPNSQELSSLLVIDAGVHRNDRDTMIKLLGQIIGKALTVVPQAIVVPLAAGAADALAGLLDIIDPIAPVAVIPITFHFTPETPEATLPSLSVPATAPTEQPDACVGVVLRSTPGNGAEGVLLRLNADGTGLFDFGESLPYQGGTVRGILTFTWTGGPDTYNTSAAVGALLAAVDIGTGTPQLIELPPDVIAEMAQPETFQCVDGAITVQRTGQHFE